MTKGLSLFSKILARTAVAAAAAGLALTASVGSASASTSAGTIGYGYSNNTHGVWCVQHLVNDIARFYGRPTITEDGLWGQQTYNQIYWVQQEYDFLGLQKDGVVGKQTGEFLLEFGDQYYGGNGYCMSYVPSSDNYIPPSPPLELD